MPIIILVINVITTIVRTIILYVFVTLSIRLMGKRQIGDMQPNELVITLLISEIAAMPLQDITQPILYGVGAIFVLVILEIAISVLAMKSFFVRKLMNGKSVVVIKNGVVDQEAMKKVRVTVIDLIEMLRSQSVFDISTVAFAVLEVNGNLSVLLNSSEQPATAKDVNANNPEAFLPLPVITDGKILEDSLTALELTEKDLATILRAHKVSSENVFLMTLDREGNTNLVKRSNT